MRSAKAIILEERVAPGATLAYYGAARAITSVFNRGPEWAIRLFIAWLGAILVYVVLGMARKGPFSPEVRPRFQTRRMPFRSRCHTVHP